MEGSVDLISKYRFGDEPSVIESYSVEFGVQFTLDDGRKVRFIHRGDHVMVHVQDGATSWSISSVGGIEEDEQPEEQESE